MTPRATGELAYADVEMWLKAPLEIRRPIMQRFIPKANDPAFRQALVANLKVPPGVGPDSLPREVQAEAAARAKRRRRRRGRGALRTD